MGWQKLLGGVEQLRSWRAPAFNEDLPGRCHSTHLLYLLVPGLSSVQPQLATISVRPCLRVAHPSGAVACTSTLSAVSLSCCLLPPGLATGAAAILSPTFSLDSELSLDCFEGFSALDSGHMAQRK